MEYYEPSEEFDFESIYRKEEEGIEVDYLKESIVLDNILNFLCPKRFEKSSTIQRVYALLFICRPHYINGDPNITQTYIAEEILGCKKQIFNSHVRAFCEKYGFHVNGMRNESSRLKMAEKTKLRAKELAEARRRSKKESKK